MIPTRELGELVARRMSGLVTEIDDLHKENERLRNDVDRLTESGDAALAEQAKLRAELADAKAQRDMLHRRLYPTPCTGCPGCSSYADCPDEIHRLTTALDAAHTDAALARDARNAMEAELAALRSDVDAAKLILPVCCGSLADAADTLRQERDALDKATTATDPDAKLRELRAWMVDKARMQLRDGFGWSFEVGHINLNSVVERIDELLAAPAKPAEPAPAQVYSRGRVIAESAEPPTAHISTAPTDDRWELVAKLADVVARMTAYDVSTNSAKAIAAQLRGGK